MLCGGNTLRSRYHWGGCAGGLYRQQRRWIVVLRQAFRTERLECLLAQFTYPSRLDELLPPDKKQVATIDWRQNGVARPVCCR